MIPATRESTTHRSLWDEGLAFAYAKGYFSVFAEAYAVGYVQGFTTEIRESLFRLGEERFGPPDERTRGRLALIIDYPRLHALVLSILDAASWDDLLSDEQTANGYSVSVQ
jgi:hypothetical protein